MSVLKSGRPLLLKFFLVAAVVMATVSCACASGLPGAGNISPAYGGRSDSSGEILLTAAKAAFCCSVPQNDEHIKRISSVCPAPQPQADVQPSATGLHAQDAQAEHGRAVCVCVSATHRRE